MDRLIDIYVHRYVCAPSGKNPGVKKRIFMRKSGHVVASNQVYFTVKALPKA